MNLDGFHITDAVIHDVPRGDAGEDELVLTDEQIALDGPLREYFRRKIISSLKTRGLDVMADVDADPCVRDAVEAVLADPAQLVAASRRVAEHLHAVQSGRNSAGLLTVVLGRIDSETCVSVLKLEREQGLRFAITTADDGRKTVDLEILRQLTLTDKTKVFKTSLLLLKKDGRAESMHGRVSDDQRGKDDGLGVANFFLSTFLGCQLRTSPETATFEFAHTAEQFFNDCVTSPERRGRYQVALLSRLQDNVLDVAPRDFARSNLDPADQPAFYEALRAAGINPDVAFEKDTSLVKINGFRMIFESGMVLVGRRDDLEKRVTIRPDGADRPGVDIVDAVKRLNGR